MPTVRTLQADLQRRALRDARTPPFKVAGMVLLRMRSERLFGKVMLPLCGYPVAQHVYWRLRSLLPKSAPVWFMATDDPADREVIVLAETLGEPYIVRPDAGWNMAAGFVQLHEAAKADVYLTAECDSPLCYTGLIRRMLPLYLMGHQNVITRTSRWQTRFVWNVLGGIGVMLPWNIALYAKWCDTDYLKGCVGPVLAFHPEAYEDVLPPTAWVDPTPEECELNPDISLELEDYCDSFVIGQLYHALWRGPGPENVIDGIEAARWALAHPQVLRYNAHRVQSKTNQIAAGQTAATAAQAELVAAMFEGMAIPGARIWKCDQCGAYLGYVIEQSGAHWFVTWSGVRLRGRGNITCRLCGAERKWYDDPNRHSAE